MTKYRVLAAICVLVLVPAAFAAQPTQRFFEYVSPRPGAKLVTCETNIIVRPHLDVPALDLKQSLRFVVTGSASGSHEGRIILSDDCRTVIFDPHRPFERGERVSVAISADKAMTGTVEVAPLSFEFEITSTKKDLLKEIYQYHERIWNDAGNDLPAQKPRGTPQTTRMNVSPRGKYMLPPDFPALNVSVNKNPGGGSVFAASFVTGISQVTHYIMILDNTGFPEYFKKIANNAKVYDFKKQPNGLLTYFDRNAHKFLAMDDTYTVIDSFASGNGYKTNFRELQLLDNGHALVMAYDGFILDMSRIYPGGNFTAIVIGLIIQELDKSKNVVFQWRSWDHLEILDATNISFTAAIIDYVHGNALDQDFDGNILVSCRSMDTIIKIDRSTGDTIWQLGGKNSDFTFAGDPDHPDGFSRQHDCRRLDNGNLTVFDSGNFHDIPHSRAVEYELDMNNMTATMVWQYRDDPDAFAPIVGNAQRLPNGNTMVGWGGTNPFAAEVRPDGKKVWEIAMPGFFCYRTFRSEWSGVAAAPTAWPDTSTVAGELHLGFVKFGDETVDKYYVYRGDSPETMTKIAETPENMIRVKDFEAGKMIYFWVSAVDVDGYESPHSNRVAIAPLFSDTKILYQADVEIHPRTLNLKSNGQWIGATIKLPGECGCEASDVAVGSIMLNDQVQAEHPGSLAGTEFTVKFQQAQVEAILPRGESVEIKITGAVGGDTFEGYDVIRVFGKGKAAAEAQTDGTPRVVALTGNYPNPFNPITTISFTTPASNLVVLSIYDTQGRLVTTLVNGPKPEGSFTAMWSGRDRSGAPVASGVYFVRLQSNGQTQTRKIVLLK
jgi:outer membrane protein assembly factor BamB